MTNRMGDWMQTFTGERFWPLDPRPDEVHIEDIAHALALTNRFGGHTPEPYSVGQHSIFVAGHCPEDLKLCGLMHDATEAYIGDMVAPVKRHMPEFKAMEARLWSAIAKRFDLPDPIPPAVMEIDLRTLIDEARALMPERIDQWDEKLGVQPLGIKIDLHLGIEWQMVERTFLRRFEILDRRRNMGIQ